MDDLELRLHRLEAIVTGLPSVTDHTKAIVALQDEIKNLRLKLDEVASRSIPDVSNFATKSELMSNIHSVSEALVDGITDGERQLSSTLEKKMSSTVGQVRDEAQAAKNAALSFGQFASDMLRLKSQEFAR